MSGSCAPEKASPARRRRIDRKSTRLNSSHVSDLVCRLLLEKKNKSSQLAANSSSSIPIGGTSTSGCDPPLQTARAARFESLSSKHSTVSVSNVRLLFHLNLLFQTIKIVLGQCHEWLGRLLVVTGFVQCALGLNFYFPESPNHRILHSFPTRRSSD